MDRFVLFFFAAALLADASNDPAACASAARALAQQKALLNGRGPSRTVRWDKYPPEVTVSPNGGMVNLSSVSSDALGRRVDTQVVFLRRLDGSWAAHRTVTQGNRTLETESWVEDSIPFTRETITEHRLESEPITSSSLPPHLASFQKHQGIPDAAIHEAYHELRKKGLSGTRPRWLPREGIVSAVELAFVRTDLAKLESTIQKGAVDFGYSPKEVESHLRGRTRPNGTVHSQAQSDYVQIMGALRSLESRGFALEMHSIRTRLLERLSDGSPPPP